LEAAHLFHITSPFMDISTLRPFGLSSCRAFNSFAERPVLPVSYPPVQTSFFPELSSAFLPTPSAEKRCSNAPFGLGRSSGFNLRGFPLLQRSLRVYLGFLRAFSSRCEAYGLLIRREVRCQVLSIAFGRRDSFPPFVPSFFMSLVSTPRIHHISVLVTRNILCQPSSRLKR